MHDWHADGVGIRSTLASTDPTVAMHPIHSNYNSREGPVLPFIFSVRKFLQLPVQVHVGFLTGPVTADQAHDHTGHDEQGDCH